MILIPSTRLLAGLVFLAVGAWFASGCAALAPDDEATQGSLNTERIATSVPMATPVPPPTSEPAFASLPTGEPPAPTAAPEPTPEPVVHVVEAGDTLFAIAGRYGVTVDVIKQANEMIVHQSVIHPGWELIIPDNTAGTAVATTTVTPPAGPSPSEPPPEPAGSETDEIRTLPNGVSCPERPVSVPPGAAVLGYSALCQIPIVSYRFGDGPVTVLLVAAIHGGYEWNSALLAYTLRDHFESFPDMIPAQLTVHLIPNANPDGLYMVTEKTAAFARDDVSDETVPGRFNGRGVDLNRNWDCEWLPTAQWGNNAVNPGPFPFSEPETAALRDFILARNPELVLFWHSALDAVIPGGCGALGPRSIEYATVFHRSSGYPYLSSFNRYAISGDASDYLSAQDIPAITVELTTHYDLDWQRNLDGLEALLAHLAAGPAPATP